MDTYDGIVADSSSRYSGAQDSGIGSDSVTHIAHTGALTQDGIVTAGRLVHGFRGGHQQTLGQSLPNQHGGFRVASGGSFLLIMSFSCGFFFFFPWWWW